MLLFVHGGPGTPAIPFHRYYENALLDHFTIVHFDQRGSGKSSNQPVIENKIYIDDFVEDVINLTIYLRQKYNKERIYILGQSWGGIIGIKAVQKKPDYFHAYIGIAQITDMSSSEQISVDYTLKKATEQNNTEIIQKLKEFGTPPYMELDKVAFQRQLLSELSGMDYQKGIRKKLKQQALFSPEYSIPELIRLFIRMKKLQRLLWPQMLNINLFDEIEQLNIPVYILGGRYDYQVPAVLAEKFIEQLNAPAGKQFIWFEHSGHLLNYEEPDKFIDVLVNVVKKETEN
jgi:pimeloyl-ACP methyl ester carboxylesterase